MHLEWTAAGSAAPKALFLRSPPKAAAVRLAPLKFAGTALVLSASCAGASAEEAAVLRQQLPTTPLTSPSLLISHLQKCVRRGHRALAVRTAATLLRHFPLQLLRRLPIIMVEDVQVLAALPVLVWLMAAAGKGFELTRAMAAWLLGLVDSLAAHPTRDTVGFDGAVDASANKGRLTAIARAKLPAEQAAILYALQLRRSHGGMPGDMAMLNNATSRWLKRFKDGGDKVTLEHVVVPIAEPQAPLGAGDWELAAVDFHVSDVAARMAGATGMDEGTLKSLIWDNVSSQNHRREGAGGAGAASGQTTDPAWTPHLDALFRKFAREHLVKKYSMGGQ